MAKVEALFSQLDNALKNSQHDQALELSDKILEQKAGDPDAFKCKIFSLIHLEKYDTVLKLLEKEKKENWVFEIAYCCYRTKKLKESLELLRSVPAPKPQILIELEAQVSYRAEDFKTSIALYEELLKTHKVDSPELKANLIAAYYGAGLVKEATALVAENKALLDSTFEFSYNAGCVDLSGSNFQSALKNLALAEKLCRKSLKEDGLSEKDILDEVAILQTQIGLVQQLQGNVEEAKRVYNEVLKNKPSDQIVQAVISNNLISLKSDYDVFDTAKKLKVLQAEEKLSTQQKNILQLNNSLLLFRMNKIDQCKEVLQSLPQDQSRSDIMTVLHASILHREKKTSEAKDLLKKYINEHPGDNRLVQLTLAQLHFLSNDIPSVLTTLEGIKSIQNRLGTVAVLVYLYEQNKDINGAIRVFDQALDAWGAEVAKTKNLDKEDQYVQLLKDNASLKMKHGLYEQAASTYEKIVKIRKTDLEALPALIMAYSKYNPQLAEKYASQLPPLNLNATEINIEALEKFSVKINRTAAVEKPKEPAADDKLAQKKKRVRRRKRLPKNFDPNIVTRPDPERWLPKHQRSAFRKKRKGNLKGGSQGTSSGDKALTDSLDANKVLAAQPPADPKASAKAAGKASAKGAANTSASGKAAAKAASKAEAAAEAKAKAAAVAAAEAKAHAAAAAEAHAKSITPKLPPGAKAKRRK